MSEKRTDQSWWKLNVKEEEERKKNNKTKKARKITKNKYKKQIWIYSNRIKTFNSKRNNQKWFWPDKILMWPILVSRKWFLCVFCMIVFFLCINITSSMSSSSSWLWSFKEKTKIHLAKKFSRNHLEPQK